MDLNRNLLLLSLSALFSGLAFSIFYYQVRYFIYSQGYSYYTQSLIETLSYAIVMPMLLAVGVLSDLYGRKPFAVASFMLGGLACLSAAAIGGLYIGVFLSIVLFNASFYIGILTRGLLVVELSQGSPGRWIGIVMSSNSLAMIAGPLLGARLLDLFGGYTNVFILSSILYIASALLVKMTRESVEAFGYGGYRSLRDAFRSKLMEVLAPGARGMLIYSFAVFMVIDKIAYSVWAPLIFVYLADRGVGEYESSILYSIENASWFLTQYMFGVLSDRINPLFVVSLSQILGGLSAYMLAFGGVSSLWIYGSFIALGMSIAAWIPAVNRSMQILFPIDVRGTIYSTLIIYSNLVGVPAPYIGGFLREAFFDTAHMVLAGSLAFINAFTPLAIYRIYRSRYRQ